MTPKERNRAVNRIQTQLIEEVGADALVIVFSRTTRRRTVTQIHSWGNALACRGLAEQAYAELCEEEIGEESEEVEEEDEDDAE